MRAYQITLRHDAGKIRITVHGAGNLDDAIAAVLKAERAPRSAIIDIKEQS